MRIRLLRNEFGYTQEELGKKVGQTKSNISKYETGALEPGIDTLREICKVFNVSLDYLMGNSPYRTFKEEYDYGVGLEASESLKSALRFFIKENINDDSQITEKLREKLNNYTRNNNNLTDEQLIVKFVDYLLFSDDMYKNTKIINDLGYYDEVDPEDHQVTNIYIKEDNKEKHAEVDDIEEAMKIILEQPGLMLKGSILSDESKIILANAIQMGLRTAEELEKKKNEGDSNE